MSFERHHAIRLKSQEKANTATQSGDFFIFLKFDLHDDVESNLEQFVTSARLGRPYDAEDYFAEVLKKYHHIFQVYAEQAEFLTSRGAYGELRKSLPKSQKQCSFRTMNGCWSDVTEPWPPVI
jgi:hypothetical protein